MEQKPNTTIVLPDINQLSNLYILRIVHSLTGVLGPHFRTLAPGPSNAKIIVNSNKKGIYSGIYDYFIVLGNSTYEIV